MKNPFRKLLGIGAIAVASILPMSGAEAQTALPADTERVERTEQTNNSNFSTSFDIANKSRFWGTPFLETPHYAQSLNFSRGNLTASVIGNVNVNQGKLFDVDADIMYSQPLSSRLSSFLGYTHFSFDLGEGWDWASVAYAGINANVPLNPSLKYNHVFRFGGGEYIEGTISQKVPVAEQTSLNLTGKLGYNINALRQGVGFTHIEGIASIPIRPSRNVTITPRIDYIHSLSPDAPAGVLGGLNLEIKF